MGKQQTFTFNLPSPEYRRFMDFIAAHRKTTPGKVLCRFIRDAVFNDLDEAASKKAHEALAINSDLPIEAVEWVHGSQASDWQKLARAIGEEKAIEYQQKFLPVWDKIMSEIDEKEGLKCFDIERRKELEEAE